jgi:CheY-like chemotaxis protein
VQDLRDVLIADASSVFRSLVATLLRPHCDRVIAVQDAESAVAAIREHPELSLAMIETCLPGNGMELLERIASGDGPRPTVLLIAPRTDPVLETRASLLGAVGVITKPITFRAIARTLAVRRAPLPEAAPRVYSAAPASAMIVAEDGKTLQLRLDVLDLSASGALLATKGPLEIGRRLHMVLSLHGELLPVTARVVRVQHPSWETLPGSGVEFDDLDPTSRSKLEVFIDRLSQNPGRSDPL